MARSLGDGELAYVSYIRTQYATEDRELTHVGPAFLVVQARQWRTGQRVEGPAAALVFVASQPPPPPPRARASSTPSLIAAFDASTSARRVDLK